MAYDSLKALCREDVNAFCEFVLRDEETGERVEQEPMHVEMQAACEAPAARVVVLAHPESGKTNQLGIGRVLWKSGRNQRRRTALIGNTQRGASKTLGAIKRYVERSPELRAVFPRLLPGSLWRDDAVTFADAPAETKDPSVQALGYHGDIQGSRVDDLVSDDLLDAENTRTEEQRSEVSRWWRLGVMTRLTAEACVAFLTNCWHEQDLSHQLARDGWRVLRYPIYASDGSSAYPKRWSLKRIADSKRLLQSEFARMFLLKPHSDEERIFPEAALLRALKEGRGLRLFKEADPGWLRDGALLIHGVDLAFTRRLKGAESCIFSLFVHPDGARQPLSVRHGRWGASALLGALQETAAAFGGVIVVEDNGAQKFVYEVASESGIALDVPVLPFTTSKIKADPTFGIESMAAEMEGGRWLVPSKLGALGPEPLGTALARWYADLRSYDPQEHPGDLLMASWIARTHALRVFQRRRRGDRNPGGFRARVLGGAM